MGNEVFQQDRSKKETPGGVFTIQLLFRDPPSNPGREKMEEVLRRHVGEVESFGLEDKVAGFVAKEHIARFEDGEAPVQLIVMDYAAAFTGAVIDDFTKRQMWDCQDDRDRILSECRYHVLAADMLAAGLSARERADLDMDFLEALAELYPTCEAFYFQSCGKLFLANDVRQHSISREDRFIRFGVNARFFNIEGTNDMLVDTVGMGILFLPDLQYHFHDMEPNWVVNHAYNLASYILSNDNPINSGETVDGIEGGRFSREIKWTCQYEDALVQPIRQVIDVCMGQYASGSRE